MSYQIREIYYTLQGEGGQSGRPAVFIRFAGCNLWSGNEKDRASAICSFCDTDFAGTDGSGGGEYQSATDVVRVARSLWPEAVNSAPFVVCTGGEPLLQLDAPLVHLLHEASFEVAVETNGTLRLPTGIDWVCVSPKAGTCLELKTGDELKLVFPQEGLDPADYEQLGFKAFRIQPMAGPDLERNTRLAMKYCLENPRWMLSLQIHKVLNIP